MSLLTSSMRLWGHFILGLFCLWNVDVFSFSLDSNSKSILGNKIRIDRNFNQNINRNHLSNLFIRTAPLISRSKPCSSNLMNNYASTSSAENFLEIQVTKDIHQKVAIIFNNSKGKLRYYIFLVVPYNSH